MSGHLTRRDLLLAGTSSLGAGLLPLNSLGQQVADSPRPRQAFRFGLNASTISGQKLSLSQQVETAAKAGYDAFEPWIRDIDLYARSGGSLPDLRKRVADMGLTLENAIGFAAWIVDDEQQRQRGLEQMKREMDLASRIGCKRIAAPPAGATDRADLDLLKAAERYRALAELGRQFGIVPQIEIWGASKCLNRLGQAALIAAESGFPQACILADVYHMYKGNSPFEGLRMLSSQALQMIHLNDYPAEPPRDSISDAHRVFPGDGIAPLQSIITYLAWVNPGCVLSLELFNREYWKMDALVCARTGLEKMKATVAKALG